MNNTSLFSKFKAPGDKQSRFYIAHNKNPFMVAAPIHFSLEMENEYQTTKESWDHSETLNTPHDKVLIVPIGYTPEKTDSKVISHILKKMGAWYNSYLETERNEKVY